MEVALVPQSWRLRRQTVFRSPHNKDYSIWGSILGFSDFGKLPNHRPPLLVVLTGLLAWKFECQDVACAYCESGRIWAVRA